MKDDNFAINFADIAKKAGLSPDDIKGILDRVDKDIEKAIKDGDIHMASLQAASAGVSYLDRIIQSVEQEVMAVKPAEAALALLYESRALHMTGGNAMQAMEITARAMAILQYARTKIKETHERLNREAKAFNDAVEKGADPDDKRSVNEQN